MAAERSIPMIQTRPNPTVSLFDLPSMWTEFHHFLRTHSGKKLQYSESGKRIKNRSNKKNNPCIHSGGRQLYYF